MFPAGEFPLDEVNVFRDCHVHHVLGTVIHRLASGDAVWMVPFLWLEHGETETIELFPRNLLKKQGVDVYDEAVILGTNTEHRIHLCGNHVWTA